jgi:RNA polymerase sigma factor (sigma-70 family)
MSRVTTSSMVRQIESLFDGGSVSGYTDRELLERFNCQRDTIGEAAFAALVARHGPMVLRVCRELLGDIHDAEDAFQAVFLVLARKASSIRDPDLLGNWLYGVALRTTRKAKKKLDRRRGHEDVAALENPSTRSSLANEPMAEPTDHPIIAREQAEVLYSEIDRLPAPFRRTIVLHFFEGLTLEETARRLRCPAGTARSRLARGCDKLRRGLIRRGFALTTAAIASALSQRSVPACVSSALCQATSRVAVQFAARQAGAGILSAPVIALAEDVLRSLFVTKIKFAAITFVFLGLVVGGAVAARVTTRQAGKPDLQSGATKTEAPELTPRPGRMFVVGRVLDPDAKPVANATTMAIARSKALGHSPALWRFQAVPIGDGHADQSGQFRLDAPRTASAGYDLFAAVAIAPGYGAGWTTLDADAAQPGAEITLRPEQIIRGRLFDIGGRPVPDVVISVSLMELPRPPGGPGPAVEQGDRVSFAWIKLSDFPAWPKPATTDAEGRFTLRGVGQNLRVVLTVLHPRFALQSIVVNTDGTAESKPITMALQPAQNITGRVTYADTGKPVPHAVLMVSSQQQADFEADAEGRFRINPPSSDGYNISAHPPGGQPYLTIRQHLDWPKGAIEQSLDLALPRGVSIRGKVVEEGSGRPIAGATVRFITHAERQGNASLNSGSTVLDTAADGSFQFGALPKPGYLSVMGPSDDYTFQSISERMANEGKPGGRRLYSHANLLLNLKPGVPSKEVDVRMRRGVTVNGQIVGPNGQPVRGAWIISRLIMRPMPGPWKLWLGDHDRSSADGRFELHGLDPDTEVPVHFLDPRQKLGATVMVSAKLPAAGPVTIHLERCGSARVRLVNAKGTPFVGGVFKRMIMMVVTPGPPDTAANELAGHLTADEAPLSHIDPIHYQDTLPTDTEGRITLPVLIPGARYRFIDRTTSRNPSGPQVRKEFTAKPGETLDLGDIVIEKPQQQ